ncbi:hypothetical protein BUALT_Bualt12G0140400 [Buddleja alternifolia]|uniref:Uncharacterized protein n=1 Tax=Buddleja alternifolia TaxID=168488 RepID=A0AAV6WZ79_9LAMI|nr:hypothetical protein BUALT_Bualt12G0140400 [Buddleja alternifolia]
MVSFRVKIFLIFHILFIISIFVTRANAVRTLHADQWLKKQVQLLESLPRGPVPPSGGSPCTYIPGQNGGVCTLNEKHFSGGGGGSAHAPPAPPSGGIDFAATPLPSDKVRE